MYGQRNLSINFWDIGSVQYDATQGFPPVFPPFVDSTLYNLVNESLNNLVDENGNNLVGPIYFSSNRFNLKYNGDQLVYGASNNLIAPLYVRYQDVDVNKLWRRI